MPTKRFPSAATLAFALVCACGDGERPGGPGEDAGASCPPCAADQTCDRASGACVLALVEGEPCGELPGDGGFVEGLCREGLECGAVGGGVSRCSRGCTAKNVSVCGEGRECFARPGSSTQGFCGKRAAVGESCDIASLTVCGPGLSCITPSSEETAGRCFANCGGAAGGCPAGQSCADPFAAEGVGFCVVPVERCDYTRLEFCGQGELCVRPPDVSWGYCHKRCEESADCGGGECVFAIPGIGYCVEPVGSCAADMAVPSCEVCDAAQDLHCGSDDLCVEIEGRTVCKPDCTREGTECPGKTVCTSLEGTGLRVCL